ncbi:MAG: beta strand repeat-containing protein [Caulobacterales bacterium]
MSGDRFFWNGASGSWDVASNWFDQTTDAAATTPPSANDAVVIETGVGTLVISGTGASASMFLEGGGSQPVLELAGQFSTGSLNAQTGLSLLAGDTLGVSGAATLNGGTVSIAGAGAELTVGGTLTTNFGTAAIDLTAGGKLSVTGAASLWDSPLTVTSGDVTVGGALSLTGAALTLSNGASVQVASLTTAENSILLPSISVDSSSTLEIGTAGGAVAGAVTIDSGAKLTLDSDTPISASIVNNGLIDSAGGGGLVDTSTLQNNGTIDFHSEAGIGALQASAIVNDGTITANSMQLDLLGPVSGTGVINVTNGVLLAGQVVGPGQSIEFGAGASGLGLSPSSLDANGVFEATLSGFGGLDTIAFSGTVTGAKFSNGVLTLTDGVTTVARLNLSGDYSGDTFAAAPLAAGETQVSLVQGGDTANAPAGGAAGLGYTWVGPVDGSWDVASNWSGGVAPGAGDGATIGSANDLQIVTGVGDAGALTLAGAVLMSGDFSVGSLTIDQTLGAIAVGGPGGVTPTIFIDAGHTLNVAGNAAPPPPPPPGGLTGRIPGADASNFNISGAGARFLVGGTLTVNVGALVVAEGGEVTAGALVLDGEASLDSTSSIEVGSAGDAAAGYLTIDAGATLSASHYTIQLTGANLLNNGLLELFGAGGASSSVVTAASFINHGTVSLSGPYPDAISASSIVNDGLIEANAGFAIGNPIDPSASLSIAGPISGTGRIEIASGNTVALDQAGAGQTIHFDGGRGGLTLSSASLDGGGVFEAIIANFTATDAIFFSGTVTHAAWSGGVLTLSDGQTIVAELKLAGDYAGAAFTPTIDGNTTEILVSGAPAYLLHDFNGDGVSDLLIENGAGSVAVGEVVNGQASYAQVASLGHEWSFEGVGDFLGDGKSDFLIENAAGAVVVGEVVNGQASYTQVGGLGPEWKVVATGDYLGEGHDQFLIENAAGAVVVGDWLSGQIHYTQIGGLGSEWMFH